jgi:hypothetical protein
MLADKLNVQVACALLGAFAAIASAGDTQQDAKGSRDHPALARVPGYYIAAYDEKKSDHAEFCLRNPADRAKVQGHRWRFTYRRAGAGASPTGEQVRHHYRTLLKKGRARPVCDADPDLDARLPQASGETWVHLRAFAPGDSYELEIIERQAP